MKRKETERSGIEFSRFHLIAIEFLLISIFFFFAISVSPVFTIQITVGLFIFFSQIFFFGLAHISFFTGVKKSSLLPKNKISELTSYLGIASTMAFCILLMFSIDIYFAEGLTFVVLFSEHYFRLGVLAWSFSYLMIAAVVYQTTSIGKELFVGGTILIAIFLSIAGYMGFCLAYQFLGLISLFMIVITIDWVNQNFIATPEENDIRELRKKGERER